MVERVNKINISAEGESMDMELFSGVSAVIVIIGLIQVLKAVLNFNAKWAPVLAVIFGLIASFGFLYYGETKAFEAVVMGLAIGLSAVGLYSGSKNTLEGFRNKT